MLHLVCLASGPQWLLLFSDIPGIQSLSAGNALVSPFPWLSALWNNLHWLRSWPRTGHQWPVSPGSPVLDTFFRTWAGRCLLHLKQLPRLFCSFLIFAPDTSLITLSPHTTPAKMLLWDSPFSFVLCILPFAVPVTCNQLRFKRVFCLNYTHPYFPGFFFSSPRFLQRYQIIGCLPAWPLLVWWLPFI